MITFVDTNALLDVLVTDAPHGDASQVALESASDQGTIIMCEDRFAPIAGRFSDRAELERFLAEQLVLLDPSFVPEVAGCMLWSAQTAASNFSRASTCWPTSSSARMRSCMPTASSRATEAITVPISQS